MERFVLLLRSEDIDFSAYSADDYQQLLKDFDTWNATLEAKGLLVSAGLKGNDAKTIRLRGGATTTDGPYCETKEAITGICIVNAGDQDDAVELAAGCPFIPRGGSVEVRGINQLEIDELVQPSEDDDEN